MDFTSFKVEVTLVELQPFVGPQPVRYPTSNSYGFSVHSGMQIGRRCRTKSTGFSSSSIAEN